MTLASSQPTHNRKRRLRLIPKSTSSPSQCPPPPPLTSVTLNPRSSYLNTRHAAASRSRSDRAPLASAAASLALVASSLAARLLPPPRRLHLRLGRAAVRARGDPRRRRVLHVLHRVARVFRAEVFGHAQASSGHRGRAVRAPPGMGFGRGARVGRDLGRRDAARGGPRRRASSPARVHSPVRSPRSSTASPFSLPKSRLPFPRDAGPSPRAARALPFHAVIEHVGAALIAVHVRLLHLAAVHAPHRLADEPDPLELVPLPFLDGVTLRLGTAVSSISPPPRPMDPCSMDTSHRVTPVSGIAGC